MSTSEEEKGKPAVGYCRPPATTRFQKGVSGNPNGRPKGSLNVVTVFMKTLRERVVINEHGQRKTVTKLEAAIKQLVNKAASGDERSIRLLVELARDAENKQSAMEGPEPSMSEIDQRVMNDILKRFSNSTQETSAAEEEKNDDQPDRE